MRRELLSLGNAADCESNVAELMKMQLAAMENDNTQAKSVVPGMDKLSFYLWDAEPKPIIMLENSHIDWYGMMSSEAFMLKIIRNIYKSNSIGDESSPGIVVDMGMNEGYISALGAAYGHDVVAVDAQPECVRRFRIAKALNGWGNKVRVYNNIVSLDDITLSVPNGVCHGTSNFLSGANIVPGFGAISNVRGSTQVTSVTLDELVGSATVLLFHLDVEGAEPNVLRSGSKLLAEKRLKNIIFEFAPYKYEKMGNKSQTLDTFGTIFNTLLCQRLFTDRQGMERVRNWKKLYDHCKRDETVLDIFCTLK